MGFRVWDWGFGVWVLGVGFRLWGLGRGFTGEGLIRARGFIFAAFVTLAAVQESRRFSLDLAEPRFRV